ncbi:MAG TPA: heme exporter protein CcmB [Coriobacteriia bacterium]
MTVANTSRAGHSASWRQFKAILRKDIVMELRTREMVTSMGLYTLLTMVVYMVAINAAGRGLDARLVSPGLLWTAFIFTSMLGLNRSFVHEKDQGCIEALLLSPVDRPMIFFAKAVGNLTFLLIVEAIAVPVFALLFMVQRGGIAGPLWMMPLALVAASIGIAGMGTLLATMSVNTSGKDFILAVMFIPLIYPLLGPAVQATTIAVLGGSTGEFWTWMAWIGGYDAIMGVAAYSLYEFVIGA